MTRTYEDGNSKLVEIVTVFDVDDEKGVCNSLFQIFKLNSKRLIFVQSLVLRFFSL